MPRSWLILGGLGVAVLVIVAVYSAVATLLAGC